MNVYEVIRVALLDLALHKFRSALATIGIVFGVASVMSMVSISDGAKRETLARIALLGVDNIIAKSVKPSQTDASAKPDQPRWVAEYGLKRRDLAHVQQGFGHVRYAVGLRNMRMNLYAPNGRQLDLSVIATEPDYLNVTRSQMQRGRPRTRLRFGIRCRQKALYLQRRTGTMAAHRNRLVQSRRDSPEQCRGQGCRRR
jgi:putative ABC transport system permease protein